MINIIVYYTILYHIISHEINLNHIRWYIFVLYDTIYYHMIHIISNYAFSYLILQYRIIVTILCHMIQYRTPRYNIVSHNTISYYNTWYNIVSLDMVLCNMVHYHFLKQCHIIEYKIILYLIQYHAIIQYYIVSNDSTLYCVVVFW